MALTETRPEADGPTVARSAPPTPGGLERLLGSGDHVAIGRLFVGFALAFAALSLTLLAVTGLDTATDNGILGSRTAQLATSAQAGVLFLGVVPLLLGIAIAIVPLQLGSAAIAFPRAAALSFWTWLVSAGIFMTSTAIDGGFGGTDTTAAKLGNVAFGAVAVALGLGAVCVATTVITHRPLGMRLAYVPGLSWASFVAASMWIVTLGAALAHVVVGQVGRMDAAKLATNFSDGLMWLFRGPTVFVFAVPVLGIAADVVSSATGRRHARPGALQLIIGLYAILAFGAWAQLPSAVNTAMWTAFAIAVGIPVVAMIAALAETLRHGKVTASPALILSVVGILLVLGAVITGWILALSLAGKGQLFVISGLTLASAQAAFVAAAAMAGGIAGALHWAPQLWGGRVSYPEGSLTVPLVLLGGGLLATATLVQAIVQLDGEATASQVFGAVEAVGAVLFALGALSGLVAAVRIAAEGHDGDPVDGGSTLEWSFPSPASGGVGLVDLARVRSPYPLLDGRDGSDEEKD